MLLVTVALVVAGVILLVVGFIDNSLTFIYAAIACAAVAAAVLFLFSRLDRRRTAHLAAAEGDLGGRDFFGDPGTDELSTAAPPRPDDLLAPPLEPAEAAAAASGDDADAVAVGVLAERTGDGGPEGSDGRGRFDDLEVPDDLRGLEEGDVEDPADDDELEGFDDGNDWEDEPVFPIEDYEDLRVSEILPVLGELEVDELAEVREREASTKNRGTIVRRIDALLRELGAPSGPASSPVEPIPGYAELRAAQVLPLLATLDAAQLEAVAVLERSGAGRATILSRISRLQAAAASVEDRDAGRPAPPPTDAPGGRRAVAPPAAPAPVRPAPAAARRSSTRTAAAGAPAAAPVGKAPARSATSSARSATSSARSATSSARSTEAPAADAAAAAARGASADRMAGKRVARSAGAPAGRPAAASPAPVSGGSGGSGASGASGRKGADKAVPAAGRAPAAGASRSAPPGPATAPAGPAKTAAAKVPGSGKAARKAIAAPAGKRTTKEA